MRVFALRHGNTFGPDQAGGERVFMSGCHNNIPLVAKGREQARAFADYLSRNNIKPSAIYANHLIRTWEMAVIINECFFAKTGRNIPLVLHEGLLELDYGAWAGLTSQGETAETNQIIAQFGLQAWQDWQNKRIFPKGAPHNWQITEQQVTNSVTNFFTELTQNHAEEETIIAIGSQGSLGFIHGLLPGGMAQAVANSQVKVKTGHFAELDYSHDDQAWRLVSWNQKS